MSGSKRLPPFGLGRPVSIQSLSNRFKKSASKIKSRALVTAKVDEAMKKVKKRTRESGSRLSLKGLRSILHGRKRIRSNYNTDNPEDLMTDVNEERTIDRQATKTKEKRSASKKCARPIVKSNLNRSQYTLNNYRKVTNDIVKYNKRKSNIGNEAKNE